MRTAVALLALAPMMWGCPKVPLKTIEASPTLSVGEQTRFDALSERARALLQAQNALFWSTWTEGKPPDLQASYQGQDDLFTEENVRWIAQLRPEDSRALRAVTALQTHFAGEVLARGLAESNEAIANLEASMTFSRAGEEIPYRDLNRRLAAERQAPARRVLYQDAFPSVERLTVMVRRRDERAGALLRTLGYAGEEAFASALHRQSPDTLLRMAEDALVRTQPLYLRLLAGVARQEHNLSLEELRAADLPRLLQSPAADKAFPPDAALGRARALAKGLGIDLDAVPGLRIDARDLPQKNPRPLALPVSIPNDVRLSVRPLPGAREQAAVFRALGHALHASFTRESRWELATLGGGAVSEAFGLLFAHLAGNPGWLSTVKNLSPRALELQKRSVQLQTLFSVRRAAGLTLYNLQRLRGAEADNDAEARALYQAHLSRAYGFALNDAEVARYRVEGGELHRSVNALLASLLAGALETQLVAKAGPTWWTTPAAGAELQRLWQSGNALSVEELAIQAGSTALDAEPLRSSVERHLAATP